MPTIRVSSVISYYTDKQTHFEVMGSTALEAVQNAVEKFPKLKFHIFDSEGNLRVITSYSIHYTKLYDLNVCFMRFVATDSKPGTFAMSRFGMFQLILWNSSEPNGIFIGMAADGFCHLVRAYRMLLNRMNTGRNLGDRGDGIRHEVGELIEIFRYLLDRDGNFPGRITSYNVCYTKLLRAALYSSIVSLPST